MLVISCRSLVCVALLLDLRTGAVLLAASGGELTMRHEFLRERGSAHHNQSLRRSSETDTETCSDL